MADTVHLDIRPCYGFTAEGDAHIIESGSTVTIHYYVWSGDVLGEALKFAKALVKSDLEFQKECSAYGNGHGMAVYIKV